MHSLRCEYEQRDKHAFELHQPHHTDVKKQLPEWQLLLGM